MEEKRGNPVLAENVKRLREEQNLTQEKLADKSGLSLNMIQKIESVERYGRKETHEKIANALGISVSQLFIAKVKSEPAPRPKSRIPDLQDDPPLEEELAKYLQAPYEVYFSKPYLSRLSNRQLRQIALQIKLMVEESENEE